MQKKIRHIKRRRIPAAKLRPTSRVISRRTFLRYGLPAAGAIAADAALETEGVGLLSLAGRGLDYIDRRLSYMTIEEIAGIIEEMGAEIYVEPKNNGNRNLVVMAEKHYYNDDAQFRFWELLNEQIPIYSFFMEGVFAKPGSHIMESIRNKEEILERELDPEWVQEHVREFERYDKKFGVRGIENREVMSDMDRLYIVRRNVAMIMNNPKDPKNANRSREIYYHLDRMNHFKLQMPRRNIVVNCKRFIKENSEFENQYRDGGYARNIESAMPPYSTFGAKMGAFHCKLIPDPDFGSFHREPTLPMLDAKGISYVAINGETIEKALINHYSRRLS